MLENNSLSMIHQFDQLQEERVHSYRLLEEGHKIYLSTGPNYDFPMFRKLVHDVTQDFKRISEGIIVVEKALRTDGYTSAADIITSLQEIDAEVRRIMKIAQSLAGEGMYDMQVEEILVSRVEELTKDDLEELISPSSDDEDETARLQLSCEMLAESDNGELETNKVKEIRNELGKVVEQINNLLTELRYEIHNGE
ncbi:Required for excision 1-B domain-containing protein-like [Homarus americanus]|uniref:Required for excision 1-B domain-containing protein-like n=1 Tax=Homarus americanus TaxID=6706 RepID=A0A8J5N2V7_HOMAM|nr:Required for excision 1-B domain-containing protein-like [Homarus americanus]